MVIGGALLFKRDVVVYADWFGKFASGFFTASVIRGGPVAGQDAENRVLPAGTRGE